MENIINENGLNKNQGTGISFDGNLADQEWINKKNYLNGINLYNGSFVNFKIHVSDTRPFQCFYGIAELYCLNQDKFIKALPLGNRLCSIDVNFDDNIEYGQMFSQKYFAEADRVRKLFNVADQSLFLNVYAYAAFKEQFPNNQEIEEFTEDCRRTNCVEYPNGRLNAEKISLDDRRKFDEIVNVFFNLPYDSMKHIVEFCSKHKDYSSMFYLQGPTNMHLNLNSTEDDLLIWKKDFPRNGALCDKFNSERWATLSSYSCYMILFFFRPEYSYQSKRPNPKLVEFYVALNSLLSIMEKENAKAILNTDDKKLTEQQKELKKKLLGKDEAFCNNIVNAWKAGFFLNKSKIKESDNLFEDKEKKFKDSFYKSRVIELIMKIENGDFKLMKQKSDFKDDLSNKKNDDEKVNFLVDQLFDGARVVGKDNITLKLDDKKREEHSQSDLSKKLALIGDKIEFPSKTVFIYDENKGLVKIIDWLISEIENDNLKLMQQEDDLNGDLSSEKNYNEKVNFLVNQLFDGAHIADKNNITYLKFDDKERKEYSQSDLPEKLKLIDNKIQFCPKAAKILKPSDRLNTDGTNCAYKFLKQAKLSELLYFENDEQKHDYVYLRENKDYYRDYILHQDYGENELYNKLYQCTQKPNFGKYKREHFIFDKTGTIIGMDILAYFDDEIANDKLILKNKEGKDISNEVKNIDNDLAREVFLMDKLKNGECSVYDNEGNEIEIDENDITTRNQIIQELQSIIISLRINMNGEYVKQDGIEKYEVNPEALNNLFNSLNDKKRKTIKDFIEMFRLEKEGIKEIVEDTHKGTHALIQRYALNKIFTKKIDPVNKENKKLIDSYVFDFSKIGCDRNDLVFSKDGRVEYVKSESLSRVLGLNDTKKLELQTRNDLIKNHECDAANNEKLQKAKDSYEDYKVSEKDSNEAKNELENLRANLDSNVCSNLSDFYDVDSCRDEFLDKCIKSYQDKEIDYKYWPSECAKKFLKDIKDKNEKDEKDKDKEDKDKDKDKDKEDKDKDKDKEDKDKDKDKDKKENDEIAEIELKFFKWQAIKLEDLSEYTKNNKQEEIKKIKVDIELKRFKDAEIKFNDLSQDTRNNRQKEIIKIEVKLLKQNKSKNLLYTASQLTLQNFELQKQKSKLTQIMHKLKPEKINNQIGLEEIDINGETILYSPNDFGNKQLPDEINTLVKNNVGLYKSKGIPYKIWDSDAKIYYHNRLQKKWGKIGAVSLLIGIVFIASFFIPLFEGYLAIKITFTVISFICGCLVVGKGIKNRIDYNYEGEDTYDNITEIPLGQKNLNDLSEKINIYDLKETEGDKNAITNNQMNSIIRNDSKKQKKSNIIPIFGDSKANIITGNNMEINNTINTTESSDSLKIPNQGDNKEQSPLKKIKIDLN